MAETKWPDWVEALKRRYLAGSSSFFILHGNVDDLVGSEVDETYRAETLSDFLAQRLFRWYDLVLHYDLGRGLRPHPGDDPQRLTQMNSTLERILGGYSSLPRDPTQVLRILDRLVTLLLVGGSKSAPKKTAFMFDYSELICPPGDRHAEHLATFLNWARSPVVKRVNMVFILMTRSLAQLHPALVQSGHTTEIQAPMPTEEERNTFITRCFPGLIQEAERLSSLSAGLTLSNLDNLLRLVVKAEPAAQPASPTLEKDDDTPPETEREIAEGETGSPEMVHQLVEEGIGSDESPAPVLTEPDKIPLSDTFITQIKKQLIESQCPGLIEFIEPKLGLDLVAGHITAKQRLADDARLIRQGNLDAVPMGYLICGPVGVGKTFIAMCYAGTVGIPCVSIKNFRSKYVGETEANLERILGVMRELGPVAVLIDEADAAVGNRGATGDSGTSARVFAQLSSQMGDTRYRGRVIWFLLTCRPDLLPVDLKRQGRCEEHIPLFYPETPEERREMFLAMAKKLRMDLDADDVPEMETPRSLSGADIEGVLTRVRRESIIQNKPVGLELISKALNDFRSPRGPEHELQWLAAILECSDLRYLPDSIRRVAETKAGYEAFTKRFQELSARLEWR